MRHSWKSGVKFRRLGRGSFVFLVGLLLPLAVISSLVPFVWSEPAPSFTFSAAGDFDGITSISGVDSRGKDVADKIAAMNPNLHIVLGDFGYAAQNPTNWCSSFRSIYPGSSGGNLVLITGDHDTSNDGSFTYADGSTGVRADTLTSTTPGGTAEGFLDTSTGYVSQCGAPAGIDWVGSGVIYGGGTCQTSLTLSSPSCYAREYYFDYPSSNPIMRFIFIVGGIGGSWVSYAVGTSHYNWLKDRIDEAKNAGLWTAVANHRNCLSDGSIGACQSTFAPFDLSLTEMGGVDLWLNGNDHNYQRSYQLQGPCSSDGNTDINSCPVVNGGDGGESSPYNRGDGTVVNVIGTGGRSGAGICNPSPGPCPRRIHFAKLCGANGDLGASEPKTAGCISNENYGFSFFTVTTTSITADWVSAICTSQPCSFTDHYVIKLVNPDSAFSISSNIVSVSQGTVGAGGTYSSVGTVSVNSFGSYAGTVNLSVGSVSGGPPGTCPGTAPSNCPTVSLSPTSLTLTQGSTASTTLTVSNTLNSPCSNPARSPGANRYRVTVTATDGSTSHQYVVLIYIFGRGDVNKSGVVNVADLAIVGGLFGRDSSDPDFNANVDLNNDGAINVSDLAGVGTNFGETC